MNKSLKNNFFLTILSILLFTSITQAQSFKTVESNSSYQLQLIDSAYFATHGNGANAVLDTSQKNILNKNGLVTLSITSGQPVKFRSIIYPDLSDYIYAGTFTCCSLYLVHAKTKYPQADDYYLINSGTGKTDTLKGHPVLSSSGTYAATNAPIGKNTMLEMSIKNLNTGVITDVSCPDETEIPTMVWKWEDDSTLLFYGLSMAQPRLIYYRVVLKE